MSFWGAKRRRISCFYTTYEILRFTSAGFCESTGSCGQNDKKGNFAEPILDMLNILKFLHVPASTIFHRVLLLILLLRPLFYSSSLYHNPNREFFQSSNLCRDTRLKPPARIVLSARASVQSSSSASSHFYAGFH